MSEPVAWLCRYTSPGGKPGQWIPTIHRRTVEARKRHGGWEFRPLYAASERLTADAFTENAKGAALASIAIEALRPFAAYADAGGGRPRAIICATNGPKGYAEVNYDDMKRASDIVKLAKTISETKE